MFEESALNFKKNPTKKDSMRFHTTVHFIPSIPAEEDFDFGRLRRFSSYDYFNLMSLIVSSSGWAMFSDDAVTRQTLCKVHVVCVASTTRMFSIVA